MYETLSKTAGNIIHYYHNYDWLICHIIILLLDKQLQTYFLWWHTVTSITLWWLGMYSISLVIPEEHMIWLWWGRPNSFQCYTEIIILIPKFKCKHFKAFGTLILGKGPLETIVLSVWMVTFLLELQNNLWDRWRINYYDMKDKQSSSASRFIQVLHC